MTDLAPVVEYRGRIKPGRPQFVITMAWIAMHPLKTAKSTELYLYLRAHVDEANQRYTVWPSKAAMAEFIGLKKPESVDPHLNALIAMGAVSEPKRRWGADGANLTNVYEIETTVPDDYRGFLYISEWDEARRQRQRAKRQGSGTLPLSTGEGSEQGGEQTLPRSTGVPLPRRAGEALPPSTGDEVELGELQPEQVEPGVCVDDGSAAANADPATSEADRVATIRAVVRGVYGAPQRARLTKPEEVADIRTLTGALLDRGWTVDALVAQLRQRVTWNSRTVAFGKNLIRGLKDVTPLEPNSALVDEFADPDEQSDGEDDRRGGAAPVPYDAPFLAFWAAYPRRRDKQAAWDKWTQRVAEGVDPEVIIAGAARYRAEREGEDAKYTKLAKTWLHNRCWENAPEPVDRASQHALLQRTEPLAVRRRREIDEAVAAFKADMDAGPAGIDPPAWPGGGHVIDSEGRPA